MEIHRSTTLTNVREARLHETLFGIAGGRHSFVDCLEGEAPKTVLDVGKYLPLERHTLIATDWHGDGSLADLTSPRLAGLRIYRP